MAKQLIAEVNNYRRSKGLGSVVANSCLCKTADKHTQQLNAGQANKHSWKSCTYSSRNANCMWNKPKEICGYPNKGQT